MLEYLLSVGNRTILGRQIQPCLVGDSAYPMHMVGETI